MDNFHRLKNKRSSVEKMLLSCMGELHKLKKLLRETKNPKTDPEVARRVYILAATLIANNQKMHAHPITWKLLLDARCEISKLANTFNVKIDY